MACVHWIATRIFCKEQFLQWVHLGPSILSQEAFSFKRLLLSWSISDVKVSVGIWQGQKKNHKRLQLQGRLGAAEVSFLIHAWILHWETAGTVRSSIGREKLGKICLLMITLQKILIGDVVIALDLRLSHGVNNLKWFLSCSDCPKSMQGEPVQKTGMLRSPSMPLPRRHLFCEYGQCKKTATNRRKFRSQTSENMDRWKAEMGRVSEEKRRKKIKKEKVSEERRSRCAKR